MMSVMIDRILAKKITVACQKYPITLLTGPRQSGKTTLVKHLFPEHTYKNLENPDERIFASRDPKSFLKLGKRQPMILDEFQVVPELASYIQNEVDVQDLPAHFILTGSQNLQISQAVSQSLAGRVALFELLPFAFTELNNSLQVDSLLQYMLQGSYPRRYIKDINPTQFYRDYVHTYVARDVRSLQNIGDLTNFQRCMQLLAGRTGQILNLSSLANDLGISVKTVDAWISVLEASYIVYRLQPYYENFGKRAIKSPKIYFYDTGLLTYLLGLDSTQELLTYHAYGQLFENVVITETLKHIWNNQLNEKLYFWRDNHGNEVDLLIDRGGEKHLVEIKSSVTFHNDMLKGLSYLAPLIKNKYKAKTTVIYAGDIEQNIQEHQIINWKSFISGKDIVMS